MVLVPDFADSNVDLPYLVVGLGNPGREYRNNRHNIGFQAVDFLAAQSGIKFGKVQSRAILASGMFTGRKIILAKPQTFMNLSGQAVSGVIRFYKIPLDNIMIIHDDLDLPFGTVRIRSEGGAGGQKGLASIIQQLGTNQFNRIRLGIGRPPGQMDPADYVLQDFHSSETETLQLILDRSYQAVKTWMMDGLTKAMNLYNGPLNKE